MWIGCFTLIVFCLAVWASFILLIAFALKWVVVLALVLLACALYANVRGRRR